ncbi:MAG: hypothetical protein LBN09_00575 [Clostridioides sp.]|nr:hypothetical protein [Clostridioides sp.]
MAKEDYVIVDMSVKDDDPEWADWLWCIAQNDLSGWVPKQILNTIEIISTEKQKAIVLENYSANELSVDEKEIVIGSRIMNGWLWCWKENSDIRGWIPLRNVINVA